MSLRLAIILLLAGTFVIAFSPTFVRLSEIGPVATAVYRVALALPVLFLFVAMGGNDGRARPATRGDWLGVILAGLFFAGDLAFWHLSITHTSVANASLFATSTPIFVTLAAWLWLGERISRRFFAGLVLGIVGAVMLAGSSLSTDPSHLFGDLMGLITAMFFSGYLIVVKRLRERLSAAAVMAWSGLVSVATLAMVNAVVGEAWLPGSINGWVVLLALALVSHALGQGLVAKAVIRLPASFSAVALLSEPLFAALIAWAVLNEAVTPLQALGGAVILAGIAISRPMPDSTLAQPQAQG
ncbi:MAG: DMT family transporter [Alphaproteobacteria bacterium]|jgi:drug/metabolite transporter (DMT)-like permease|nr:DMT family transporter [Alphaproteobacteria bacterium]